MLAHHRTGSGEPLVLLHGVGSHWAAFGPVLERLSARHEVWAVDLPGFGGSPPLADEAPTVPALARAVGDFMRAQGIERFHVAGNSTGGGVALDLGRTGWARSVCALSPIGFHNAAELRYSRASLRLSRRVARRLGDRRGAVAATAAGRTVAGAQYFRRPGRIPAADFEAALDALAAATGFEATLRCAVGSPFERGREIGCPVTIAWGSHDLLLPAATQSRRARRALPAARHVRLQGCGHVPMSDDPGQVARVLLDAAARGAGAGAGERAG